MRPELFYIPLPDWLPLEGLPIRGYGAMLALGFLTAILVAGRRARSADENPDHIYNMAILSLLGGVIGARLFDVIEYSRDYPQWWHGAFLWEGVDALWLIVGGVAGGLLAAFGVLPWSYDAQKKPRRKAVIAWTIALAVVAGRGAFVSAHRDQYAGFIHALMVTSGGLTVYGGLILALALVVPYLVYLQRREGVNALKMTDIVAPSLALGLAFGRLGCFLNGCCYGAPSDLPWAFRWPEGSLPWQKWHDVPLHPAQIYGIINALLLFVVLHFWYRHKSRHGVVLGGFFGLYAVSRILLEAVRSDEAKIYFGMSISQTVGLAALVLVIGYFLWLRTTPLSRLTWQPPESATRTAAPAAKGGKSGKKNHRKK